MAASKQGETTWFIDTGATNHVTADLSNLSIHSDYVGNDHLTVSNGKGFSISTTGCSQYFSNGNLVSLHNIFHVPAIFQNLLSVSQFTKDNDCYFVFTSSGFYVKENRTGRILVRGMIRNGLYPLYLDQCFKNKMPTSPSVFSCTRVSRNLWHQRLGHAAHQVLQQLAPSPSMGHPSLPLCVLCLSNGETVKITFFTVCF